MRAIPVVVDLDGTLVHTDMLHESILKIFRQNPLYFFLILFYCFLGKAAVKRFLADRIKVDPAILPYNKPLLEWLKEQRNLGRKIVLCTASDYVVAEVIASHLGIFDHVMASDGKINLAGVRKSEALEKRFGLKGFDYVGNSKVDLSVWKKARQAIVVNASSSLVKKASECCEVVKVFPSTSLNYKIWFKALRVHQWLKNLLLFIPFLAAHRITNLAAWDALFMAFISFSFCASSVYIMNDLFDLDSDRRHPRKCNRAFASGIIPIWAGVFLFPVLLITSLILAINLNIYFAMWLSVYFMLTCAYSFTLKRIVIIDCLTLAVLYTLRIIAGTAVVSLTLSFWLLAFSIFLFLSLAFVKRYAELEIQILKHNKKISGRGYYTSDAQLISIQGMVSGYVSVLILALYLHSDEIRRLYATPEIVWCALPVLLFWVSWIWVQAHRGNMHDDPLVFSVKNKESLVAGVIFATILFVGAIGLPW